MSPFLPGTLAFFILVERFFLPRPRHRGNIADGEDVPISLREPAQS